MVVSCQPRALAALFLDIGFQVPTKEEAGWAPEMVWTS
jgi:hypothetical protein